MAIKQKHRVQLGLETTRGTPVAATLELQLVGDMFNAVTRHVQVPIMASGTFPYITASESVGLVVESITARVDVNVNTVRDLLLLATKRTSGVLPAVTIIDDQQGVGVNRYSGCVMQSLALEASRSRDPDEGSILSAVATWAAMKVESGAGAINGGLSAPVGRRFQERHGSQLINNAPIGVLLSRRLTINNALALGPVDATNLREYIDDGVETHELTLRAKHAAETIHALQIAGGDITTNTAVWATGVVNETVTGTIAKARLEQRSRPDQDNVMTEEWSLVPFYGAAAPIVWTFGSSIGASVLGL